MSIRVIQEVAPSKVQYGQVLGPDEESKKSRLLSLHPVYNGDFSNLARFRQIEEGIRTVLQNYRDRSTNEWSSSALGRLAEEEWLSNMTSLFQGKPGYFLVRESQNKDDAVSVDNSKCWMRFSFALRNEAKGLTPFASIEEQFDLFRTVTRRLGLDEKEIKTGYNDGLSELNLASLISEGWSPLFSAT